MFMKNYVRNILIFVVTFSLVFGLCIIPSYADDNIIFPQIGYTDSSYNNNTNSEFAISACNSGYIYGSVISSSYTRYGSLCAYGNSTLPIYAFLAADKVYIGFSLEDYPNPYLTQVSGNKLDYDSENTQDIYAIADLSSSFTNTTYNIGYRYITQGIANIVYSANLPIFDTLDNALSSLRNYIDNPPVTETVYNAYFDIPCGNVAYIKTGNDNTLTLSCTMPEFSKLTGGTGTYWTNTMEIAYGVPSYPPAGITFPLSSMSDIQWFRSTEGRDLLGRTKKALFLDTTQSSDNFIVIYNPTYRELSMSGQGDINPTIRVQCSALINYHMYSLTGEYNSQGTISSYSIDGFSDPYVGTPTSDNENVQGTNSTGATPNIGGSGNEIGGTGGIIEYVQGIQNTLDNFANSFISLLKAPISHIQSLISSGTDYFNVIRGLYGWLPDEVQGTINSAMIVSISVGVIALLL